MEAKLLYALDQYIWAIEKLTHNDSTELSVLSYLNKARDIFPAQEFDEAISAVTAFYRKETSGKETSEKEASGGTRKSGCFIASATYGNYNSPEVVYLSAFRDDVLKRTKGGQWFINFYYTVSPCLAETISRFKILQMLSRVFLLRPIIFMLRQIRRP
ncbi:MAG: hypothetical protein NTY36_13925 [Deltaproteobacteria bacterium]|nr:hypothetical protein [Deltaproteobacteria bacterium]